MKLSDALALAAPAQSEIVKLFDPREACVGGIGQSLVCRGVALVRRPRQVHHSGFERESDADRIDTDRDRRLIHRPREQQIRCADDGSVTQAAKP